MITIIIIIIISTSNINNSNNVTLMLIINYHMILRIFNRDFNISAGLQKPTQPYPSGASA